MAEMKSIHYHVFSSPEPKTQVSFSNHNLSVVAVIIVVGLNISHFHLLLQNHRANYNQTWHKLFLVEGESNLFQLRMKGPALFQGYIIKKIAKKHRQI